MRLFIMLLLVTLPAFATGIMDLVLIDKTDTLWVMLSTLLVLLMLIPGLGLFYGGMMRAQNVLTTIALSYVCVAVATIVWVALGYTLAATEGNWWIGGLSKVMLHDVQFGTHLNIPELLNVMYQISYAAFAIGLLYGAVHDRIRFQAMLVFMPLWLLFVYCPIFHIVWGPYGLVKGYTSGQGSGLFGLPPIMDFAGGLVVQVSAGISGLVAALLVGPSTVVRPDRHDHHSIRLTLIGTAFLWIGWFGFTAGSTYSPTLQAATAMINTQIAAATGLLTWMGSDWILTGKPRLRGMMCGILSGLVCISPAAGYVTVAGAMLIGMIGTIVCYWSCHMMRQHTIIDDTLNVFGIHCVAGVTGTLLTGIYADIAIGGLPGLLDGQNWQLLSQLTGVILVLAYAAAASYILLRLISSMMQLRLSAEEEYLGTDWVIHGETTGDKMRREHV
jgi:Amt family ammonium transporter